MARRGRNALVSLVLGVSYMIFFAGSYYLLFNTNLIHASSIIKFLIWFGLITLMLLIYPLLLHHHKRRK